MRDGWSLQGRAVCFKAYRALRVFVPWPTRRLGEGGRPGSVSLNPGTLNYDEFLINKHNYQKQTEKSN